MKSKCLNILLICSVSLLLISSSLSILPMIEVNAQSSTILSVEPSRTGAYLYDTFQVDINITDVEYLYGYEFRLFYNMYVITAIDLEPHAGTNNEEGFFFTQPSPPGYAVWKYEINNNDEYGNGTGYVWLAVTRPLGTPEGLSGNGRLARITFSADYLGVSDLKFDLRILGPLTGDPIEHSVSEGKVVVGDPPTASFTHSPQYPLVDEDVTFDASASTGYDGSTPQGLTAYWDFGDGEDGTGIVTTHAYSAQGTYTVNLTVTDPINRNASVVAIIPVSKNKIQLTPNLGPVGTTVQINGSGFRPLSQIMLSFNDMQLSEILASAGGNFTATINVPLSERGKHSIKAWYDNRTAFIEAPFKVVDLTPLNVNIDVGAIHFRGEIAEFNVGTTFNGQFVDADIINATLHYLEGTQSFDLTADADLITTGLFRIPFTLPVKPVDAPAGTYVLVVEARYLPDPSFNIEFVNSTGASFKSFLLSHTLTGWNNLLVNINGTVGTIMTDVGLINVELADINPRITTIDGNIATIETDIGTIQADITTIDMESLPSIADAQASQGTSLQTTLALSALAAIGALGTLALILRKRKTQ